MPKHIQPGNEPLDPDNVPTYGQWTLVNSKLATLKNLMTSGSSLMTAVRNLLMNSTYGLAALKTKMNSMIRQVDIMWTYESDIITVTSAAGNKTLQSLTPPADLDMDDVAHAYLMLQVREIYNSHAANENKLHGDQYITIFDGTNHNAILLVGNSFTVPALTPGQGKIVYGNFDIKAYVTPGLAMAISWKDADAEENNLLFRDVSTGLRLIMK